MRRQQCSPQQTSLRLVSIAVSGFRCIRVERPIGLSFQSNAIAVSGCVYLESKGEKEGIWGCVLNARRKREGFLYSVNKFINTNLAKTNERTSGRKNK